jgi:hypothetical protein
MKADSDKDNNVNINTHYNMSVTSYAAAVITSTFPVSDSNNNSNSNLTQKVGITPSSSPSYSSVCSASIDGYSPSLLLPSIPTQNSRDCKSDSILIGSTSSYNTHAPPSTSSSVTTNFHSDYLNSRNIDFSLSLNNNNNSFRISDSHLPSSLDMNFPPFANEEIRHMSDMDLYDLIGDLGNIGLHTENSIALLNNTRNNNENDILLLDSVCNSTRSLSLELGLGLGLNNFSITTAPLQPSVVEDCFLLSSDIGLHSQSISVAQAEALLREDDD